MQENPGDKAADQILFSPESSAADTKNVPYTSLYYPDIESTYSIILYEKFVNKNILKICFIIRTQLLSAP